MITLQLLLALASASGPQSAASLDPLAPARRGQLECETPDVARKTCSALTRYEFQPYDEILAHRQILLEPTMLIVMRLVAVYEMRDDLICTNIDSIREGDFLVGGQPANATLNALLEKEVEKALIGEETCVRHVPQADGTVLSVNIVDEVARPELDDTLLWVSPDDGYRVAP